MNSARWWLVVLCLALIGCTVSCEPNTAASPSSTPPLTGGGISEIAAASTTCGQFAAGAAHALAQIRYSVDGNTISQINPPDAFYYWLKVVPSTSGPDVVTITQSADAAGAPTFAANGSGVYDKFSATAGTCEPLSHSLTFPGGAVTVTFTASAGMAFYIEVGFATSSLVRQATPPVGIIKFLFSTGGVSGSTREVDLVKT
jgi:hypothetical protein